MFGEGSQLSRFLDTNSWNIGWAKDSDSKGAKGAWARIQHIEPGDLFAIKGYGGRNHLQVHQVGKVIAVDTENGQLKFEPADVPLFRAKAPGKPGDGTWFETLVEITNPEVRAAIFEVGTSRQAPASPALPKNLILYGPPGTGKTYSLLTDIRPLFQLDNGVDGGIALDVSELTWFQVTALALDELGPSEVPTLASHPLVQAKYAERGIRSSLNANLWGRLQMHAVKDSKTVKYERRSGATIFDRLPDGRWHLPEGLPEEVKALREPGGADLDPVDNQFFVAFHPSFTYEDFVEGLRPESDAEDESIVRYPIRAGIFKLACERAVQLSGFSAGLDAFCRLEATERRRLLEDAPPVVVFVDEISRGNVARIFGELITLLETDKRLGSRHEVIVDLPGSRRRFGVPSNLWLIGTMNTADRSVVALDTALRRRFAFRECPPRPDLLDGIDVEGIDLGHMLRTINERILRLRDRDHLIGHAFFMGMAKDASHRTVAELRRVFREAIVPLLQEYFYDDLGRIGLILGGAFVQGESRDDDIFASGFEHGQREDLADRTVWRLTDLDLLLAEDFAAIYA